MRQRDNVLLLVVGFGLGQGSLFLVQSWLVSGGHVEFIGRYGVVFTFLVLGFYVLDWGGVKILARAQVVDSSAISCYFWSLVTVRCLVLALVGLVSILLSAREANGLHYYYVLFALPGLLASTLNAGGILDGLQQSGFNGLGGSLPYVLTAASLPYAASATPTAAGVALGVSYSVGIATHILVQHALLRNFGLYLSRPCASANHVREMFRSGGLFLLGWVPFQLMFRVQVLIVLSFFGTGPAGLLIYVRQIVNAALQVPDFVRRAEFAEMIIFLTHPRSFTEMFKKQIASFCAAFGCSAVLLLLASSVFFAGVRSFEEATLLLLAFSLHPSFSALIDSSLVVAYSRQRYRFAAQCGLLVLLASSLVSVFAGVLGVFILIPIGEAVIILFAGLIMMRLMTSMQSR